jgi:hypothetical protein
MPNQQILEKAIQKAIDGGWDTFGTGSQQIDVEEIKLIDSELQPDIGVDKSGIYICIHRHHGTYSVPELIFNHDFAKALWGERRIEQPIYRLTPVKIPGWKDHLQQMVIAEDPIKYLEESLE